LWLAEGDLPRADRWVQEHRPLASERSSFAQEAYEIACARVFIALGRFNEAVDLLGRLGKSAQARGRNGRLIEIRVLEAIARIAEGDGKKANLALEQALLLAKPEGYSRVFLDEDEPIKLLLIDFQKKLISHKNQDTKMSEYVNHLLKEFKEPTIP
jgi:LuxR family maltose regulon positive regulatory protein